MKKTVIAIVAVVFLVAVVVTATHRWGYTQYGTFYYHDYPFYGYPQVEQPVGVYVPAAEPVVVYPRSVSSEYLYIPGSEPVVMYPSPISSDYVYRYGMSYAPRSEEGQLCGLMNGVAYGCEFGLECDYSAGAMRGTGVCARPRGEYPTPVMNYPYYFG